MLMQVPARTTKPYFQVSIRPSMDGPQTEKALLTSGEEKLLLQRRLNSHSQLSTHMCWLVTERLCSSANIHIEYIGFAAGTTSFDSQITARSDQIHTLGC